MQTLVASFPEYLQTEFEQRRRQFNPERTLRESPWSSLTPPIPPARGSPAWEDAIEPMPDSDLRGQPEPQFAIDQRRAWWPRSLRERLQPPLCSFCPLRPKIRVPSLAKTRSCTAREARRHLRSALTSPPAFSNLKYQAVLDLQGRWDVLSVTKHGALTECRQLGHAPHFIRTNSHD